MGWRLVLPAPPVHIYFSELWDSNYVARFYDICESFLDRVYFLIFNKEAPAFSPEAKSLIATMGDWYVDESFTYIMVFGSNATHMLPKVVPDKLVLEDISFQTVTEGIYKKCAAPKRKVWPKFPITLGYLSIPTSTWESELSDHIVSLKLGFASKRKHDPKGIIDLHLRQNHFKIGYAHEETSDDFIYQGVDNFSEVLVRAKRKEEQSHILQ